MMQLSMPCAIKADIMCSIVLTAASPFFSTVPLSVAETYVAIAGISGAPSRSMRLKIIPVFSSAGRKLASIFNPV